MHVRGIRGHRRHHQCTTKAPPHFQTRRQHRHSKNSHSGLQTHRAMFRPRLSPGNTPTTAPPGCLRYRHSRGKHQLTAGARPTDAVSASPGTRTRGCSPIADGPACRVSRQDRQPVQPTHNGWPPLWCLPTGVTRRHPCRPSGSPAQEPQVRIPPDLDPSPSIQRPGCTPRADTRAFATPHRLHHSAGHHPSGS